MDEEHEGDDEAIGVDIELEPRSATSRDAPFMPTVAFRLPCLRIEPDATAEGLGTVGIEQRYRPLLRPLPLAGGAAISRDGNGEFPQVETLRTRAPWMGAVLDVVERHLAVQHWTGRPWVRLPPMLLVGPPGTGKSRLAADLGRVLGLPTTTLNLAGTSDARALEGTARGWTGAQPCLAALAMSQSRTANPLIICEEIDKAGGSGRNGDPAKVLLNMLERHTASRWYDPCLLATVDLGEVNWILTANTLHGLSAPLLSRLEVLRVEGPDIRHFDDLLGSVLLDIAGAWDVPVAELPMLHGSVRRKLKQRFARERSARGLAHDVEAALQSVLGLSPRAYH